MMEISISKFVHMKNTKCTKSAILRRCFRTSLARSVPALRSGPDRGVKQVDSCCGVVYSAMEYMEFLDMEKFTSILCLFCTVYKVQCNQRRSPLSQGRVGQLPPPRPPRPSGIPSRIRAPDRCMCSSLEFSRLRPNKSSLKL